MMDTLPPDGQMALNPTHIRRIILEQAKRANVGHIGSAMCVVDILAALYGGVLQVSAPDAADRDRFVLSKGHAALALYAALALRGWILRTELDQYCGEDTRLGVHPETALPGVDFCTGSLGQGLSMASGAALAARMQSSQRRVFCLVSDAECNEGAVWEAAMFSAHHKLSNLTVIVDENRQQAFGLTKDVIDQTNLAERWAAFGWAVTPVDGHDISALEVALRPRGDGAPRAVIARTVLGKGVSFMEQGRAVTQTHIAPHPINWHYLPLSDAEYAQALAELDQLG
jgi:transketolase